MKKKLYAAAALGVAGVLGFSFLQPGISSATVPGNNTLVSESYGGGSTVSGGTASDGAIISANGKFAAFTSGAYDAVQTDVNYKVDAFVRDLGNQTTDLVSVSTNGVQGDDHSFAGAISSTGRYVAFTSLATNLIDGSTWSPASNDYQLYLRDTKTNTTTLLSKNGSNQLANGRIFADGVSSDGRFVLFETTATNLGPSVTNTNTSNLYMLDRSSGSFTLLNKDNSGSLQNSGVQPNARMSCDGSLVVFTSDAALTAPSVVGSSVYLRDVRSGSQLSNVTVAADNESGSPTISCNGDYVGYASMASNLDTTVGSYSYTDHIFVYDRVNDTTVMADKTSANAVGDFSAGCRVAFTFAPHCVSVSDSGIASFTSLASNLDSASTSKSVKQVFVRDIQGGSPMLLSRDSGGTEGGLNSVFPVISADSKKALYTSSATNLTTDTDTNSATDAFVSETGF